MLVFRKEKLVFLAVPKTGTTALEGALGPRASLVVHEPSELKHSTFQRYQRFIEPLFRVAGVEDLECMAVIRHPVEWLSSWFRYRARNDLVGKPASTRGMKFNDFVQHYCEEKPPACARVGSQARFLQDKHGVVGVKHIFRYEAQDTLKTFLTDRFGNYAEPKRLNVSPDITVKISPSVIKELEAAHPLEFATWENAQS